MAQNATAPHTFDLDCAESVKQLKPWGFFRHPPNYF